MKSSHIAFSTVLVAIGFVLTDLSAAQAVTCDSTCNQIRRACRRVAMSTLKVEYANCDDTRDGCRADCVANADQCPIDCATIYDACVIGGGLTCDADQTQCLDDCANCKTICNDQRVMCRDDAKQARIGANALCDAARDSCPTDCVEPIDPMCVRDAASDKRKCDDVAKRAEKSCKAACPKGTDRRACMRNCRRIKNFDLGVCADKEAFDLGTCAGLILP